MENDPLCTRIKMSLADTIQSRDCKSPYINHKNAQNIEFGNYQETYNWIECESIHYPGRTYFFNLRTQCSTWIRPVSTHIQLQYFKKSRMYNNNFTSDLDNVLITISDSENRNNNYNEDKEIDGKEEDKKINFCHPEFLAHSNYDTNRTFFNNNNEESSTDNFSYISKKFSEKHNYSILHDLLYNEIVKDFSAENNFERCTSETKLLDTERKKQSNKDYVDTALHLKNITPDCLIKKKVQGKKMKQGIKKQTQLEKLKLKTKKIICHMYDTKTVNYEPKSELPPGIKVTNLSDSSSTTLSHYINDVKSTVLSNSEIPNVNSCVDLSSESSSSCSSSCTTSDSIDASKTG